MTAFDVGMSDCSSDVCSSDLLAVRGLCADHHLWPAGQRVPVPAGRIGRAGRLDHGRHGGGLALRAQQARVVQVPVPGDRKSVGSGNSVSVRLERGGRRSITNTYTKTYTYRYSPYNKKK